MPSQSVWITPGQDPKLSPTVQVSRYITWFKKLLAECPAVVVYLRISSRNRWRHKADLLLEGFRRILAEKEVRVLSEHVEQCSGQVKNLENRQALRNAIVDAKAKGGVVLAPTSSRYLRGDHYNTITDPLAKPCREEWERFLEELGLEENNNLYAWIDPDAGNNEDEHFLTELSQAVSGKRGGRPPKKTRLWYVNRKNGHLDEILRLRHEGNSLGRIAKLTGITKPTVQRWMNLHKEQSSRAPASDPRLSS